MPGTDDIASQLVPTASASVRYAQGEIAAWNPETFENTIRWGTVLLRNVPILAGTDALSYAAGQAVGLMGWDATGTRGATTWWIMGRLIAPGTGAAESQIRFLTTTLGRRLATTIAAERWNFDIIEATEGTTSLTWTDLDTVGPQLTVEVVTNKMLVTIGDWLQFEGGSGGGMSIEVRDESGSVVVPAGDYKLQVISGGSGNPTQWAEVTKELPIEGLAPGLYTITAKYLAIGTGTCHHTNRTMSAEGL